MTKIYLRFKTNKITIKYSDKKDVFSGDLKFAQRKGNKITVQAKFFKRPVRDRFRYIIMKSHGKWNINYPDGSNVELFTHEKDKKIKSIPDNNILLILESPHKSEYIIQGNELIPIAPAAGSAGSNMHEYLISHIFPMLDFLGINVENDKEYNLCLVNPVPYQTSLSHVHGRRLNSSLRNKIWKSLYPHCREDFIKRLQKYKPIIILNGCTSELKKEITPELEAYKDIQQFSVSHPQTWKQYLGSFVKLDYSKH